MHNFNGGVGDPEWMDQQAEKAEIEGEKLLITFPNLLHNVQTTDRAQLEKNIESSLSNLKLITKI